MSWAKNLVQNDGVVEATDALGRKSTKRGKEKKKGFPFFGGGQKRKNW